MLKDDLVTNYGWSTARPTCSSDYIVPVVLRILKGLDAQRVLDLGAGNGALCATLSLGGFDVVGIDYDQGGVTIAQSAHPHIPFYTFGVQDDPAALLELELPFQVVVSTEVIEHLYSPHLLPQYARQVLFPGGHLIVSTPYHGYLKNLAISLANKWDSHHVPLWHGGHIKFWSRKTLTALLEQNGFAVKTFFGAGRAPYFWKSMVIVAKVI